MQYGSNKQDSQELGDVDPEGQYGDTGDGCFFLVDMPMCVVIIRGSATHGDIIYS